MKQLFKNWSYYLISSAMDGNSKAIEEIAGICSHLHIKVLFTFTLIDTAMFISL